MKWLITNVLLSGCLLVLVHGDCDVANVCVTDMTDEDCGTGMELVSNLMVFGCCPGCQASSGTVPEPETSVCTAPSACLEDGRYAPVQCKGDVFTGRCFCSDENGNRIFGQMWRSDAGASEMTCACSRQRADLEAAGRSDVTLHCASNGEYEPLQCDDGLCWCAEPKTGYPTVPPVLEEDMHLLPCYSASQVGEQYLRRCESIVQALAKIRKEQTEHNTIFLSNPTSSCDYDGSYGPYQISNSIAYCTGRDGEILGAWQAASSDMAGMNCNCARDTSVYFPAQGMTVSETCSGNGNYQPAQQAGDYYYCVDSDGYPTTDFEDAWPADNCASYA